MIFWHCLPSLIRGVFILRKGILLRCVSCNEQVKVLILEPFILIMVSIPSTPIVDANTCVW